MKILFILKKKLNGTDPADNQVGVSTGLYNSASFVSDMLTDIGIENKMVVVNDNNDIDREVTQYRPTHVIIEALWVVPSKFSVLIPLHPTVTWIVRLHSEMPFLAGEGSAMDWVGDYTTIPNVIVACNSPRMLDEIQFFCSHKNNLGYVETSKKVIYLPNYYPTDFKTKPYRIEDPFNEYIDIGCFGAIRPLKNHLLQAHAAVKFAAAIGKKLRFHINTNRLEMKGDSVYHNLKGYFQQLSLKGHELIGHVWVPREGFVEICSQMDIGMQVTLSETFNIVGADLISQGVPLVTSVEIPWAVKEYIADPVRSNDIFEKLLATHTAPQDNVAKTQKALAVYVEHTKGVWNDYFKEEKL